MCRMARRTAAAVLMAAGLGSAVGAQGAYNAIGSGGPLWWFPENDTSYSRHHDRYYMSHVEALNDDWGAATSFPTVAGEQVWVSDISGAPPNSACDVRNGVELVNVGSGVSQRRGAAATHFPHPGRRSFTPAASPRAGVSPGCRCRCTSGSGGRA